MFTVHNHLPVSFYALWPTQVDKPEGRGSIPDGVIEILI